MEDYCRIFLDIKENDAFISSVRMPDNEREKLQQGQRIEEDLEISVSVKNKTKHYNDLIADALDMLFVSDKFKAVLEANESPDKLQFVPVDVSNKKYWILNILNLIPAFDGEKSIYTHFGEPKVVYKVSNLVLKKDALKGVNIFRLKEQALHVFVSKQMHDAIVQNNITGIEFIYTMDLTKHFD